MKTKLETDLPKHHFQNNSENSIARKEMLNYVVMGTSMVAQW